MNIISLKVFKGEEARRISIEKKITFLDLCNLIVKIFRLQNLNRYTLRFKEEGKLVKIIQNDEDFRKCINSSQSLNPPILRLEVENKETDITDSWVIITATKIIKNEESHKEEEMVVVEEKKVELENVSSSSFPSIFGFQLPSFEHKRSSNEQRYIEEEKEQDKKEVEGKKSEEERNKITPTKFEDTKKDESNFGFSEVVQCVANDFDKATISIATIQKSSSSSTNPSAKLLASCLAISQNVSSECQSISEASKKEGFSCSNQTLADCMQISTEIQTLCLSETRNSKLEKCTLDFSSRVPCSEDLSNQIIVQCIVPQSSLNQTAENEKLFQLCKQLSSDTSKDCKALASKLAEELKAL
jgi:hypothetical protein